MTVSVNKSSIVLSIALLWISDVSLADLKRNPFERPFVESSAAANTDVAGRNATPWSPQLRAVLAAGKNSVVNLGGAVLAIGESAHGYRLLSVSGETATFSRRGETVVISVHEQEEE